MIGEKSIKTFLSCCVNELFGHQGYAIAAGFAAAAHLDSVLEVIARLDAANRKSSSGLFSFIKVSWMNDGVTRSVVVIVRRRDIGVAVSVVGVIICRREIGVTLSVVVIVCRRDLIKINTVDCVQTLVEVCHTDTVQLRKPVMDLYRCVDIVY